MSRSVITVALAVTVIWSVFAATLSSIVLGASVCAGLTLLVITLYKVSRYRS